MGLSCVEVVGPLTPTTHKAFSHQERFAGFGQKDTFSIILSAGSAVVCSYLFGFEGNGLFFCCLDSYSQLMSPDDRDYYYVLD